MKNVSLFCLLLLCCGIVHADVELNSTEDKLSYTVGQQIGQQLGMENIPVQREALFKGISDFLDKQQPQLNYSEQQMIVEEFRSSEVQRKQDENRKSLLQGQVYLKANATKKGIKSTKSGLQYKIVKAATGVKPTLDDTIEVHYEGRLQNGTVFDSSYKQDKPMKMPLKQAMPGWQEALLMMPVGSKWQLTIPSQLAYGESGGGEKIPANAVLIFDVEVISILPESDRVGYRSH